MGGEAPRWGGWGWIRRHRGHDGCSRAGFCTWGASPGDIEALEKGGNEKGGNPLRDPVAFARLTGSHLPPPPERAPRRSCALGKEGNGEQGPRGSTLHAVYIKALPGAFIRRVQWAGSIVRGEEEGG